MDLDYIAGDFIVSDEFSSNVVSISIFTHFYSNLLPKSY